ncbi:hypothetical protein Tco_0152980 [Tanacetum coccineum]
MDANIEEPNHENEDVKFDSDTFTNPFAPPETSSIQLPQDTVGETSSIFIDQVAPSPSTSPNTETTTPIQDANVEGPNHENEDA